MGYTLDFQDVFSYSGNFLNGAWLTLKLSISSMLIGLVIAIPGAWGRIHGARFLRRVIGLYVEIIRNTPLLIQIYLVCFGFPGIGIRLSPDMAALFALTLNAGAYSIEIIRSGIEAIDRGQIEAGRALGLREYQIFRLIVLRPAINNIYPALTSQFIFLMLLSSMVSMISVNDLTAVANHVQSVTFRSFEVYIIVTAIYFTLSSGLSLIFSAIYRNFIAYPTH